MSEGTSAALAKPSAPDENTLTRYRQALVGASPEACLRWAAETFPGQVVFASSLGAEDQVLFDIASKAGLLSATHGIVPFTLDTGRLFPETLELLSRTEAKYAARIRVYYPDSTEVEAMVAEGGIDLFRNSVDERHRCCDVRKVRPLRRALRGQKLWIVGLRQDQNQNRAGLEKLVWDDANGLLKLSPLLDWTFESVQAYLDEQGVPHNVLHARGYPSIGCAPCTRAVAPGEDPRSGRWWWEQETARECGLHLVNGRLVRKR
jgi:phosphoadenosine phosphosulfate reductase